MAAVKTSQPFLSNDPLADAPTMNGLDSSAYIAYVEDPNFSTSAGPLKEPGPLRDANVYTDPAKSTIQDQPGESNPSHNGIAAPAQGQPIVPPFVESTNHLMTPKQGPTGEPTIGTGDYLVDGYHEPENSAQVVPKIQNVASSFMPGATKLKRYLEETNELIVCPGVHDGFSARIAMSLGFDALYMVRMIFTTVSISWTILNYAQTGAGTTASRLGMADLGLAQLHDMREHADMIANLDPDGPPLIADMDTGYGGKSDYRLNPGDGVFPP